METPLSTLPVRRLWRGGPDRSAALTALKVSAVVGTVLNLINQGGHVVAGGAVSWPHAVLNYLVPFCVSLYSGWRSQRRRAETLPAATASRPD
ncbi:nitrate/nitrite transporter NrtS [Ramlibacter sp. AW1]|uniref:Nitrate/nitrite transporter NrtS n=1 Tax=Ramlibacter aurantiacus TaxID=2801330 RepID=A0A936ZYE7_9BURK|nr:nitrate/nitrite transporter NrtS [Ramlibacter aurantiacus]MBL0422759.1 nitrate/nitrite transporter NrtS [Ramlibacter aurantiacus]